MPRLLSLNVGIPRDVSWNGKSVRTAVWKSPVLGRRMARKLNIDGDAQADLEGHGGEQRAVFVYQMDSYHHWEQFLGRNDFTFGQFGENFTVEGLLDDEVCIGDRYSIGDAVFEVTQPRVTCYRVGIRMNEPRMPALLVAHRRPGFYFRVLQEGKVGADDEILKVADGPERVTVAGLDALLYLPGHSREQLEQALRIPALSRGWQSSFQAMLEQESDSKSVQGNAGLANEEQAPAWPGFKQMRAAQIRKESDSVTSFVFAPVDGQPLPLFQPGQFVVLRLHVDPHTPPVLRNYSLSDLPAADHFRISVKSELHGIGSSFLCNRVREGDVLDVSAPRGSFTLQPDKNPVVLLSAGVGATPVMSMLHALAAEKSQRQVWWIYGARDRANLCGPSSFLDNMRNGLRDWGVLAKNVHMEVFGALEGITPGMARADRTPHLPAGLPGTGPSVSFARSGLTAAWDRRFGSLLELAEACDVPVRWSCRTGVCHTCMTGLIGGSVTYQPEPLESPVPGNVLVCCSRPDADLILDL